MKRRELLLNRLEEIGNSLEGKDGALLLLGLGSVGSELGRLDEYSDLDFFVIVEPGRKARFLNNLDWLEDVYPLAYSFMNTVDGHKIMFRDGIYGEYAVFEARELDNIPYRGGRIVWKHPRKEEVEVPLANDRLIPDSRQEELAYAINEALTNLYVGLCRFARGEKLSALRFVQGSAIGSILSVLHLIEKENDHFPDPFGNERRLEQRFPRFATLLGGMLLGYEHVPESALAILNFLESVYPVNERLSEEIRKLATPEECRDNKIKNNMY
ncbi:hypothetical protein LBW89_00650 [Paenibacillus sp. alder61]|uniref:hypothetical protein n=1 Tax=Paenibacillus sp. alder61 TaxID=2862948 RepID=UPI001CD7F62B|nr:hypothetical protein [Paenibacillus sp. alder61]MCA1291518.1 hypothetical protein [Paenibacillus sp. alder61]